ncbi:MAG: hypothetical protein G01um101425_27 [Candidatus Peregrinibacteria bacterium Gr01-1014_25]|nr:MAG: hypothetical protein G01um101425_27 [Candidatus Peregrinibacteria bacterium Gr01-1014_25]
MSFNTSLLSGAYVRLRSADRHVLLWIAGAACSAAAAGLLAHQAAAVRSIDADLVPVAARIPRLEQRLSVLRAQVEVAQVHAALRSGSVDEVIRTAVLPADDRTKDVVGVLEEIMAAAQDAGLVRQAGMVTLADPKDEGGLRTVDATVSLRATAEGEEMVLGILDASGLMTLGDVVTRDDRALLLRLTEEESPAAVQAVEQLLATDLLASALDSQAAEYLFLRSFSSPLVAQALEGIMTQPRIAHLRTILGGPLGLALKENGHWPMRFMTVEQVRRELLSDGTVSLTITVRAYGRTAASAS